MKVLSFNHVVQGPAAAQYLADMGADVIKIEPLEGSTATVLAHPVRYDGEVPRFRHMPAVLGAQTREILREAGWREEEIDNLAERGVVNLGES